MQTSLLQRRSRLGRRLSWLVVASMTTTAILVPSSPALAGDKTEIVICHGTGSQENPYVVNSPAINSSGAFVGQLAAGHNDHVGPIWFPGITVTWGDIIPAYDYAPANFHFNGLNWTAEGQAIYNNGCNIPQPTPTPDADAHADPDPHAHADPDADAHAYPDPNANADADAHADADPNANADADAHAHAYPDPNANADADARRPRLPRPQRQRPTPNPTPTPNLPTPPVIVPTPTPTPEPTPEPTGEVLAETGAPQVTLPPTDALSGSTQAPTNESWRMILLAMAGILATTLLLTPTMAPAKRKDR